MQSFLDTPERLFATEVVRRLRAAGQQALWAGGCVRDEMLGLVPKDYDVATDARPEQVRRLFRPTVAVGLSFGVIQVLGPRSDHGLLKVEVATFRADGTYSDGRHPDSVVFASAREDALRRDFTINGMFFDPVDGQLLDYVGGREDLRDRILRAIGDPEERFAEDKLRLLRAVRFATHFDMTLDPATEAAVKAMAGQITVVSEERIAEELRRLLVYPQRARGVDLLFEIGLVRPLVPELLEMKGLPQGRPDAPTGDLWDHVMRVLELLGPEPSFPLAFATLLHDVGKRRTVGRTPDRYTFYYHEHVGARMASDICLRLKLSNAERERVEWLVEKHQLLCDARQMRTSKLKPILAHPGIRELLTLHRADALASGRSIDHVEYCEKLLGEWSDTDLNPPPLLTGHDLTRHGLEPGPQFKRLLDAVREAQLDGTVTTPKQAMELVDRILQKAESKPMPVELVHVTTRDGVRLDGCYQSAAGQPQIPVEAFCFIHGTGGNFYSSTLFDVIANRLLELGCGVLRVNTRGHDGISTAVTDRGGRRLGAAYEIVDDCRHDLAAWLEWLRQRAGPRVGLVGHSLGAVKALYALSADPRQPVTCLIAVSPPRLSYATFCTSDQGRIFLETYQRAEQLVQSGLPAALMEVQLPLPIVITAAGYVEKYGPNERYNFMRFAAGVPCPTLLTLGGVEVEKNMAFRGIPEDLEAVSRRHGRFAVEVVPGADHFYTGVRDELIRRIEAWVKDDLAVI